MRFSRQKATWSPGLMPRLRKSWEMRFASASSSANVMA